MEGAWLGANHGNPYFSTSVDPGEHHICVDMRSSLISSRKQRAHFTAGAGSIYYFRTRFALAGGVEMLVLEPIDSDQGKYLVETSALSPQNRTSDVSRCIPPFAKAEKGASARLEPQSPHPIYSSVCNGRRGNAALLAPCASVENAGNRCENDVLPIEMS
jgi:hypothetical protein